MTTINANTRHARAVAGLCAVALLAGAGAMTGCRGDRSDSPPRQFFPDMDDQPKLMPQAGSQFFEDGRADRGLVARTVPYGSTTHDPRTLDGVAWGERIVAERRDILREDATFAFGVMPGSDPQAPTYAETIPVEVDRDLIIRGRERFDIYCSACHGYTGVGGRAEGAGTVGRLWSYDPANLLAELYRDPSTDQGKDGYLFHVIRNGLTNPDGTYRMPPYAHAVDERDAWAIVAYIRTLQAAQGVPVSDLAPADRARLEPTGGTQ